MKLQNCFIALAVSTRFCVYVSQIIDCMTCNKVYKPYKNICFEFLNTGWKGLTLLHGI